MSCPELMIHGLEYLLLTIKAFKKLPFYANNPDPDPEADVLD